MKGRRNGIEIQDVRIKRADLPEMNEKAVSSRMQAERGTCRAQYRAEGAEEARRRSNRSRKGPGNYPVEAPS